MVELVSNIGPNARQVLRSLSAEYTPAPRSQTRQLTAYVAYRYPELIEREWQDGCAQCTYYRLTPLGVDVVRDLSARLEGEEA